MIKIDVGMHFLTGQNQFLTKGCFVEVCQTQTFVNIKHLQIILQYNLLRSISSTMKPYNKQPVKKQQPIKQAPKEWKAQDYVSSTVPVEEVRDVKAAFDIFDSDGAGSVDPNELKQAFVSLGLANSNKLVHQILTGLDGDHPNGLNFTDFLKLATGKLGEAHSRKQIQNVFASFDSHKNGKIDAHQFKFVANELGEYLSDEQIEKIFTKTDMDSDGYVTAEDFYQIMCTPHQ